MHCFILAKVSLVALLIPAAFKVPASNLHAGDPQSIATGTWGGEHMALEVSAKGADAELDCAHGKITQPIVLDNRGDFDAAGTFTREHGGPVRRDEAPTSSPAHYSGRVVGDTMTVTIVLEKEKLGPFTLTHGGRPLLRKCR